MMVTGLLNPIGYCEFIGGFQARFGVLIAQPQNSQGRIIALFFYAYAFKDTVNSFPSVSADSSCPVFDTGIIPWGEPELIRHIFCMGRILFFSPSRETVMGSQPDRAAVNLHGTVSHLQVYTFPSVLIRAGIPVVLKNNVVINVYFSPVHPCGDLIWGRRSAWRLSFSSRYAS